MSDEHEPKKSLTLADVRVKVQALLDENPELVGDHNSIPMLMNEMMRFTGGTIGPMYLRPLISMVVHGKNAVPALLERLLHETSLMRLHADEAMCVEIDMTESMIANLMKMLQEKAAK